VMDEETLERVRAVIAAIPPGSVLAYGDVAARAGLPGRARLVGRQHPVPRHDRAAQEHRTARAAARRGRARRRRTDPDASLPPGLKDGRAHGLRCAGLYHRRRATWRLAALRRMRTHDPRLAPWVLRSEDAGR
jgi:alkylated DNA nucleotide flippase Atl1